ncbi:hypothetical protein RZN05_18670 [Sphingomonas sp. HF-S4]|uniref:Uncharacterized protein n=1 Tax=Sphingomonas agrestis TaxID=3080540 RepID=A0ABU3YCJ2_9SPHN|nr:hypothetical protein [Sphingomonas sp. HF-S4]MDV3459029.1 hypothetical protein [Sphingomonas sp. HF-S4]
MIRNLIGAFIGNRIDRRDGRGGVKGAAIGYVAQRAITRMGVPGMVLAGGYGLWKMRSDRRKQRKA